jgi:hypothetical protein
MLTESEVRELSLDVRQQYADARGNNDFDRVHDCLLAARVLAIVLEEDMPSDDDPEPVLKEG